MSCLGILDKPMLRLKVLYDFEGQFHQIIGQFQIPIPASHCRAVLRAGG